MINMQAGIGFQTFSFLPDSYDAKPANQIKQYKVIHKVTLTSPVHQDRR